MQPSGPDCRSSNVQMPDGAELRCDVVSTLELRHNSCRMLIVIRDGST